MPLQMDNGLSKVSSNKVLEERGIFPKEPWKGFKITWEGGNVYCTENQVFLLNDYTTATAQELVTDQSELLGTDFKPRKVTLIEAGMVMCGRKRVTLDGDENGISGHLMPLGGVWVGDEYLEQQVKLGNYNKYSSEYIFPGNPIARAMRRLMMSLMGEKEDVSE